MYSIKTLLAHPAFRILVSAFAALLAYGGWAYWVNAEHGMMAALKAAFVQGAYSFSITLILSLIIETLFKRFHHYRGGSVLIGVCVCLLLYATSVTVNYLAGTPELLFTILPSASISTIFTVSYIIGLNSLEPS